MNLCLHEYLEVYRNVCVGSKYTSDKSSNKHYKKINVVITRVICIANTLIRKCIEY